MQNPWITPNFTNFGRFRADYVEKTTTAVDKDTKSKIEQELNTLADVLFLPLSVGVKFPGIVGAVISYDDATRIWKLDSATASASTYIQQIIGHNNVAANEVDYIDIVLDYAETFGKTDQTPLVFTSLVSETYYNNQTIFTRFGGYVVDKAAQDATCRILLETYKDSSWKCFSPESTAHCGYSGMKIGIDILFQTTSESTDTTFYTPGLPYITNALFVVSSDRITVKCYTWYDLNPGSIVTECESKIRAKFIKGTGDYTDFTAVDGSVWYSDWETSFKTGQHYVTGYQLSSNSLYKVYVQVDAKVGSDNMEWTYIGGTTTSVRGDPGRKDKTPRMEV